MLDLESWQSTWTFCARRADYGCTRLQHLHRLISCRKWLFNSLTWIFSRLHVPDVMNTCVVFLFRRFPLDVRFLLLLHGRTGSATWNNPVLCVILGVLFSQRNRVKNTQLSKRHSSPMCSAKLCIIKLRFFLLLLINDEVPRSWGGELINTRWGVPPDTYRHAHLFNDGLHWFWSLFLSTGVTHTHTHTHTHIHIHHLQLFQTR